MITYEIAKKREEKVVDYYEKEFKKVDEKALRISVNQYDYADLVMYSSRGTYHCIEVKYRDYDRNYLLMNGVYVDYAKLKNIQSTFGVKSFTLITLTSDGYYFKSIISDNCRKKTVRAPKRSCFGAKEYIDKEMLVTHNHIVIGRSCELDIEYKPMSMETFNNLMKNIIDKK